MIIDALHRIANHRQSLSREEARAVMSQVLTGKCTDAQIAALLVALHMKGETVEEIVGFAEAIRAAATPMSLRPDHTVDVSGTERDALVDTCGTGGDASGTFNISTATALVAAGAGVRVAKHGNRSVTSKCGSADVMEALGGRLFETGFCDSHAGQAAICTRSVDCSVRSLWRAVQVSVDQVLDKITLSDLLQNEQDMNSWVKTIPGPVTIRLN